MDHGHLFDFCTELKHFFPYFSFTCDSGFSKPAYFSNAIETNRRFDTSAVVVVVVVVVVTAVTIVVVTAVTIVVVVVTLLWFAASMSSTKTLNSTNGNQESSSSEIPATISSSFVRLDDCGNNVNNDSQNNISGHRKGKLKRQNKFDDGSYIAEKGSLKANQSFTYQTKHSYYNSSAFSPSSTRSAISSSFREDVIREAIDRKPAVLIQPRQSKRR